MRRSARFRPFRHSPAWLLAFGLFAMALQAMGGSGLMPRVTAAGGVQMEICTSKGVGKLAIPLQPGRTSLPESGHQDCCTLCAASAPLLLADAALGVPPAPTFGDVFVAAAFLWPATLAWLSHPPRGPPQA
ncbi:MAG: DUF2946 domain-containing protein [Betaproteobacteria bacterium]|nr:DUF2946 domain-containing protein [Betaproteobacteria bacterium]